MLIKTGKSIPESEVTSESIYQSRRDFIKGLSQTIVAASTLAATPVAFSAQSSPYAAQGSPLSNVKPAYTVDEEKTPFEIITQYNNFYEFGTDKSDPAKYEDKFVSHPWKVKIEGHCDKPGEYWLDDLLKPIQLEERIFRFRCVEAWSMVIPWVGFALSDLLKQFAPNSKAKYVEFTTLYDPKQMPGQASKFSTINWPYVEGLTIQEAMHPLATFAVGIYGKTLLPQNGAPFRLVVPWKYGFKSIKSIVKIRFTDKQPRTTWEALAPNEYGFYANVNPQVDHPRWSQKTERRLPSSFFSPNKRDTLMFNGYADEVGQLYSQLDLKKYY